MAQTDDPSPPDDIVKLIFIHHSCGENWLADWDGGLGLALRDNNYFVSDTYYGWGPDGIGDYTDIGHWWLWFQGPNRDIYLNALFTESERMWDSYSRLADDPGGENEIIMFKSCYPNSYLGGNTKDPPVTGTNHLRGQDCWSEHHTVANAKGIYVDLLDYFATRLDKLFIVVTAPPQVENETDHTHAANARSLNNWLVNEWLDGYLYTNVAVFDFFNILTSNGGNTSTTDTGWEGGNHHRWRNGAVQHVRTVDNNYAAYGSDAWDSHPTAAGNQKATVEFVPVLNVFYHRWKSGDIGCSLSLTTPDGGEIWCEGESEDITWTSGGTSGAVTIEYSTNTGTSWQPVIAETPDDGTYPWTVSNIPSTDCVVKICDALDPACCDTSESTFQICQCGPVEIMTEHLPAGMQGRSYNETVDATGGCVPFSWSIESGRLPEGLELGSSSGLISGIPSGVGTFLFTLRVRDVFGDTDQKEFSIRIDEYDRSKGDANCDGAINILDVVFVVNIILNLVEPTLDQHWCADSNGPSTCDGDGAINILDAVKIVGLILGTDECP